MSGLLFSVLPMGSVVGVLLLWLFSSVMLVPINDHSYCYAHRRASEKECIFSSSFVLILLVEVCGFLLVLVEYVGLGCVYVIFLVFVFW